MPKPGALERGHIRARLIRELATGEHTQVQLGERYGVDQTSIRSFAKRHAEAIDRVRGRLDDQFAALWAADKVARVAEYEKQIDDIADRLDEVRPGRDYAEMVRTSQAALRAIADELGAIPSRVQVEGHVGLDVVLNGVDVGALT